MSGFVHLHCHSAWSLLDGAMPAEALAHLAARGGFEAVALTDHDALTGAVRFSTACRAAGIKPLFGAELTVRPPGSQGEREGHGQPGHVTAIARDARGYANLCRLITDAHLSNERGDPATTFEAIAERAEGLFVLSGCLRGEVARLAAAGALPQAVETARRWRGALGDGYRVEVFDHRAYGHRALRDRLLRVAAEAGVPPVATNDVHYPVASQAPTHTILNAIKDIVPLERARAERPTSEFHLKDPAAMRRLFADAPESCDETLRIAEACDFDLDLGTYHFPNLPLPPGESATGLLARRCFEGARRRYGTISRAIEDRLQHELRLIFEMGFAAYFLLVGDIVDHTRRVLGIRCACRGSAAGSLVCYVLGISDVDPVRYDLLFERFMNRRREELPDIDLDVESHRREEVLAHILDTYGAEQTAMCCMVDTFRARGAIREVGKALGLPEDEIGTIAKSFPHISAGAIQGALERLPELQGSNLGGDRLRQLFELCEAIDGYPRHLALHPSGVVLSSPDLADRVPMQRSFGGFTMLQADKDDVEALGLAKLDVLGVRMLSAISHAVAEIERVHGERVDLDALPHDDEATFRLIRSSRTLGCFQIESPGQRDLLARFQPNRFEDLIVDISLFRPGPVKSDMVTPFLDRRHGFARVVYQHPVLEPILAETNGVVVYHEQVIRVIAAVTGCSLDDADHVRRHLDSQGPDGAAGSDGTREWFISAALANGFEREPTERIWKEVLSFASFGFCKSHAAAFAWPTYLSAWLKAHHPAAFLAGVLTHDPGMYPRRSIVADARQLGIAILPLDVTSSERVYRAEPGDGMPGGNLGGIRLALGEVRGISGAEVDSLLEARRQRPFTSLEDLWRRTELSRPVLENLAEVGALDSIEPHRSRRELMWRVIELAERPRPQPGRQLTLDLDRPIQEALPGLAPLTAREETEAELRVSGIDARRHVMDLYRPLVAELGCTSATELGRCRNRSEVWVAGVKVSTQTPAIRSGSRIIFLTLDDLTGPIDVTLFERVQPWCARTVFHHWLLLVRGELRKRGGASFVHEADPTNVGITIVAEEVLDLAILAADRRAGSSLAEALVSQRKRLGSPTPGDPEQAPALVRLWHSSGGSAG